MFCCSNNIHIIRLSRQLISLRNWRLSCFCLYVNSNQPYNMWQKPWIHNILRFAHKWDWLGRPIFLCVRETSWLRKWAFNINWRWVVLISVLLSSAGRLVAARSQPAARVPPYGRSHGTNVLSLSSLTPVCFLSNGEPSEQEPNLAVQAIQVSQ